MIAHQMSYWQCIEFTFTSTGLKILPELLEMLNNAVSLLEGMPKNTANDTSRIPVM